MDDIAKINEGFDETRRNNWRERCVRAEVDTYPMDGKRQPKRMGYKSTLPHSTPNVDTEAQICVHPAGSSARERSLESYQYSPTRPPTNYSKTGQAKICCQENLEEHT